MVPEKSMRIGQPDLEGAPEPRGSATAGIRRIGSKLFTDVLPSVIATVLGAWIVSHYVNTDKQTGKPASPVQSESPVSAQPAPQATSPTSTVRMIPGASVVPMPSAQPKPAAVREDGQQGDKLEVDERKVVTLPAKTAAPSPRRAATTKPPAPAPKVQAQRQPEPQGPSSADVAPIVAPAAVAAPVAPPPIADSSGDTPQTAAAVAEDALEKARKALERAKADKEPQQPPAAAPEFATAVPREVLPAPAAMPQNETAVMRPAAPPEISPVPPLPPPVIVARPPLPSRSANADAQPVYSAQTDDDEDRPVPPAPIPNTPRAKGGFLLIR